MNLRDKLRAALAFDDLVKLHDEILSRAQTETATPQEVIVMITLSKSLARTETIVSAMIEAMGPLEQMVKGFEQGINTVSGSYVARDAKQAIAKLHSAIGGERE